MTSGRRINREQKTISAMMRIYCRDHHPGTDRLCADCTALLDYAHRRLDTCPFQEDKPACNLCEVHCYSAVMRERVRTVMRYAGPRMLWPHPILSLYHLLDRRRHAPTLAPRASAQPRSTGREDRTSGHR
jgi:predicted amidophosphoribosyltransferase